MNMIDRYKKIDNFHTTLIDFIYQVKCDKNEIIAMTIMCRLLSKSNKKYNNEALFEKERLNRYIIDYNVLNQNINEISFINFSLLIPNDGVIKDYDLSSAINFLLDTIYDNNLLDEVLFEREKRIYIESLLNGYKNIEFIAEKNMLDLLDEDGIFNKIKYKDIENIEKLTIKDVIKFFNKYIKNTKPNIIINGNVDIDLVDNIIYDSLKDMKLTKNKLIKNYDYFYNKYELISKVDKSDFYQSIVYLAYTFKDYSEKDKYILNLINLLLTSQSSELLLERLRKQNGLVYTCGSTVMLKNGLLIIKSMTNNNGIKLSKLIIDDLINSFKNPEKYSSNIDKVLNNICMNIEREKDSFFAITTDVINDYFKSDKTTNEELEIMKSISMDDIKEFINRIVLVCDYTLEGV